MTEGHSFTFPDESRAELDKALDDLMLRARDVLSTQSRLRALLKANQAVIEHMELPTVLRRIIEAAVELVGAQYGALGVVSPSGGLEQFINVGMPPEVARHIGHLPEGLGLLGALIIDPHPIRIPQLSADPRSVGFPDGHPPMSSFLGVPIRVRDEVYGNLYLSNQVSGAFSEDDEQLVTALAATAGIAIENARLFAETHSRQAWAAAAAEITDALLSSDDIDVMSVLVSRAHNLADADVVWHVEPTEDGLSLTVETARGLDADGAVGIAFPSRAMDGETLTLGNRARLLDDCGAFDVTLPDGRRLGPAMAISLSGSGLLLVGRLVGGSPFTAVELELAADFAGRASLAIELAAARLGRQRLALIEDRARIARDLHDHVIQQLFATGLELQSAAGSAPPDLAQRMAQAVVNLDGTISQIRTVIFALTVPSTDAGDNVRHSILDLANELAPRLATTPTVTFSGPVDLVIDHELAGDVVAVTREALLNVIKHANARHSSIDLAAVDGEIRLRISDDGHGAAGATRRSGVANLEDRARIRGGRFDFVSNADGTLVSWSVPFASDPGRVGA